jgi:hypothetical protein
MQYALQIEGPSVPRAFGALRSKAIQEWEFTHEYHAFDGSFWLIVRRFSKKDNRYFFTERIQYSHQDVMRLDDQRNLYWDALHADPERLRRLEADEAAQNRKQAA